MYKYTQRARPRNLYQLDLFDDFLREEDFRAANPAARRLAGQFGLSIHHAAVLMQLHGLGAR
jgi:hypothetical protein